MYLYALKLWAYVPFISATLRAHILHQTQADNTLAAKYIAIDDFQFDHKPMLGWQAGLL